MANSWKNKDHLIYEELTPNAGWTDDLNCHFLLVDLPDFKKDEVKLQVDNHGNVMVSGERQKSENKHIRFEKTFKVPDNSNLQQITGKFEEGILYVIVPKQTKDDDEEEVEEEEESDTENANGAEEESGHEEMNEEDENIEHGNDKHHKEDDNERKDEEEEAHRHYVSGENWKNEAGLLQSLIEKLKKNKGMVTMVVLAFSLGVLVSNKFQSNENFRSSSTSVIV